MRIRAIIFHIASTGAIHTSVLILDQDPPWRTSRRLVTKRKTRWRERAVRRRGTEARALAHAAGHEAPDRDFAVKPQPPNHRAAIAVRLSDHGIVWNVDPFTVQFHAVMPVLRIPIGICDREAVRERTAWPPAG